MRLTRDDASQPLRHRISARSGLRQQPGVGLHGPGWTDQGWSGRAAWPPHYSTVPLGRSRRSPESSIVTHWSQIFRQLATSWLRRLAHLHARASGTRSSVRASNQRSVQKPVVRRLYLLSGSCSFAIRIPDNRRGYRSRKLHLGRLLDHRSHGSGTARPLRETRVRSPREASPAFQDKKCLGFA
jgi:hypothetical protein